MPHKTAQLVIQAYPVLVMSNESSTETVDGYSLELVQEYPVAGKKRYFRLFALGGHDF